MGRLSVRPRCSAAVERGRCHLMKEVPDTSGTLLRSIIWALSTSLPGDGLSGAAYLQLEVELGLDICQLGAPSRGRGKVSLLTRRFLGTVGMVSVWVANATERRIVDMAHRRLAWRRRESRLYRLYVGPRWRIQTAECNGATRWQDRDWEWISCEPRTAIQLLLRSLLRCL